MDSKLIDEPEADGLTHHVAAAHQLGHDERLPVLLAKVEHRHDLRMRTEPAHRLRLTLHTLTAHAVQPLGLDQRERNITVKQRIVRKVHILLATLPKKTLNHIPARNERRRLRFSRGLRDRCCRGACPAAQPFLAPVRSRQKRRGILVPRIEIEDLARQLPDKPPVAPRPGRLDPVEQPVNLALNPLTRHREGSLVIAVARCPPAIHAPAPHRCRTGASTETEERWP